MQSPVVGRAPVVEILRGYGLSDVDQLQVEERPDVVPANADAARAVCAGPRDGRDDLRAAQRLPVRTDGRPGGRPVEPEYTGFDAWNHQRDVATPAFDVFKTPNVDTLYSNAWLDLTEGPALDPHPADPRALLQAPFPRRVLELDEPQLEDGRAGGGLFLVTAPGWSGPCPPGRNGSVSRARTCGF